MLSSCETLVRVVVAHRHARISSHSAERLNPCFRSHVHFPSNVFVLFFSSFSYFNVFILFPFLSFFFFLLSHFFLSFFLYLSSVFFVSFFHFFLF